MKTHPHKIFQWLGVYYSYDVKVLNEPKLAQGGYTYDVEPLKRKTHLWFDWITLHTKKL